MKILIVSWNFPPANVIAAVRVGKLARYLHRRGHEVRVLTGPVEGGDASLPVEIPEACIIRTPWLDVDKFAHPFGRLHARRAQGGAAKAVAAARPQTRLARLRARLATHYNALVFLPDRQIGWAPYVVAAAKRLMRAWRPDVVFASGPPFTSHVAAAAISKRCGAPWIGEFRDRWSDDPYEFGYKTRLSQFLEARLEKRCMRTASGVVTVSEPWAEMYRKALGLPVAVVYNGYDPVDFPPPEPPTPAPGEPLNIAHLGAVYAGRDPSPLFQAVPQSGLRPDELQVRFYGAQIESVPLLAARFGVAAYVQACGTVPYAESLRIQRESDVLLLLQWNNPAEFGNVPGKLFEYFAVQRPILGIGLESGVPASLIRANAAGVFSNDPAEIAQALRRWAEEKRRLGFVRPLPASVRERFARDEQYAKFEAFAEEIVAAARRPAVVGAPERAPQEPAAAYELADLSRFDRPFLTVIVDTEEEFDWTAPFSRHDFSVDSIQHQTAAHAVFDRFGVVPTYLVDYPVAADAAAARCLRALMEDGRCVIGAQLHPWVNPPHEEELNRRNSFLNNLDPELQARKLELLSELIARQFAIQPTIFKAGRFGFDLSTARLLKDFGYRIDTSVVPHTTFAPQQGPSFFGFPDQPFWLDPERELLELPLTCGFAGRLADRGPELFPKADRGLPRRLHVGGFLARSGLLERIKLSPEGVDLAAQKRLTRALLARGCKAFVLTYHSSSLLPGGNPYVRNARDRAAFLKRIEGYLRFFAEEVGGEMLSVPQIAERISRSTEIRKEGRVEAALVRITG